MAISSAESLALFVLPMVRVCPDTVISALMMRMSESWVSIGLYPKLTLALILSMLNMSWRFGRLSNALPKLLTFSKLVNPSNVCKEVLPLNVWTIPVTDCVYSGGMLVKDVQLANMKLIVFSDVELICGALVNDEQLSNILVAF